MNHPFLGSKGRVDYAVSWDFPVAMITINSTFLVIYISIVLILRYKVRMDFDRFQVLCILLFALCVIGTLKRTTLPI